MPERFSLRARLASFRHAFRGLSTLLREQHNARIHAIATFVVVVLALWSELDRLEWAILLGVIGLVWAAEALNSGLEYLADALHPDPHPLIGKAKDVAAAGVLLTAITAVAVGALLFIPRWL